MRYLLDEGLPPDFASQLNRLFYPEFNPPPVIHSRDLGYLGLPDPSFSGVLDWVLDLCDGIGIPHTLKEIGVEEAHARRLAPMAAADPSSPTNPIPLDAANLEALYLRAINGAL